MFTRPFTLYHLSLLQSNGCSYKRVTSKFRTYGFWNCQTINCRDLNCHRILHIYFSISCSNWQGKLINVSSSPSEREHHNFSSHLATSATPNRAIVSHANIQDRISFVITWQFVRSFAMYSVIQMFQGMARASSFNQKQTGPRGSQDIREDRQINGPGLLSVQLLIYAMCRYPFLALCQTEFPIRSPQALLQPKGNGPSTELFALFHGSGYNRNAGIKQIVNADFQFRAQPVKNNHGQQTHYTGTSSGSRCACG